MITVCCVLCIVGVCVSSTASVSLPVQSAGSFQMQTMAPPTCTFLLKDVSNHRQHLRCLEPVNQKFEQPEESYDTEVPRVEQLTICSEKTCATCGLEFQSRESQVEHYKSDWHRFNIKARLMNEKAVTEEQFESIGSDCDSISATDSESEENVEIVHDAGKLLFMNSNREVIEINRILIEGKNESLSEGELMARVNSIFENDHRMALIMIAGGHFAAAIFHNGRVLESKTFHSYTVRKKQGGTQSIRNNQGNAPQSAGASLRIYNEVSLAQKVRNCLMSWEASLQRCDLVLYRALRANRDILLGGKSPLFSKTDPRLRTIPMMTRRPTFKEILRVHDCLTSIVIVRDPVSYYEKRSVPATKAKTREKSAPSKKPIDSRADRDSEGEESPKAVRKKASKKPPPPTHRRKELHEELFLACTDNNLAEFEAVLEKASTEDLPSVFSKPIDDSQNTVLHLCCRRGRIDMLKTILKMQPDLTATNNEKQTPYTVAINNAVRQLLIEYRTAHPTALDYARARIPEKLVQPKVSKKKSSSKSNHLGRASPKTTTCDSCQKQFDSIPLTADDRKFCSVNCVRLWRFGSRAGGSDPA